MTSVIADQIEIPANVPKELVINQSYEAYAMAGNDPFKAIARLHQGPGIYWTPNIGFGEPGWFITRNDYVREAFTHWQDFSSDYRALEVLGIPWKLNPIEFDPPEHTAYRNILNPIFSPASVVKMDEAVKAACFDLIAKFEDRGSCEFISEFGEVFPAQIFLDVIGMPKEQLAQFLVWERSMLRESDPQKRVGSMMAILQFIKAFVAEQKQNPTSDLMSAMVGAKLNGERPLTDEEILGMCYLFYIGGLDTVYSMLGWIFRHLANDLPLQDRLRANPEDIPKAVEEFLRCYGVASPTRRARQDFEFHGIQFKAGDVIKLCTPAASRDPLAYDDPDTVNIDRGARYLAFATGPHMCLGMHLARREMRVVIEAFLSKFKNIRMIAGEEYQYHTGGIFGVDKLMLTWDRI
ncbi:cytochrome P450 [Halioxenophilus sp. WMMB6]|uniref:cytochrome P450 n=1 Tax=Halioxenophilus sp. WMMB6 TaxID=3073815 RepID=UPI00295F5A5B|nr:cytochrome P450 [Halioxenophilus sp. WMMB6]